MEIYVDRERDIYINTYIYIVFWSWLGFEAGFTSNILAGQPGAGDLPILGWLGCSMGPNRY